MNQVDTALKIRVDDRYPSGDARHVCDHLMDYAPVGALRVMEGFINLRNKKLVLREATTKYGLQFSEITLIAF